MSASAHRSIRLESHAAVSTNTSGGWNALRQKSAAARRHPELRTRSPSRNKKARTAVQHNTARRQKAQTWEKVREGSTSCPPARRTPAAPAQGGRAHVPVRSTSFIGDLSKDSMVAPSLDSAFSSAVGWLLTWARFLASVFPVSRNLALPVSIFNLLRVQKTKNKKTQAGTFGLPAWPQWYRAASPLSSTMGLLKNCFSPLLLSKLCSAHSGRCVLPFGQLPCHCLRLNTGSRLCKQQPKQVRPRPARGRRHPPSPRPFRKGLTDNSDTFQAARLPAAISLFITGTALVPPTVLSAAVHTPGVVNKRRVLPSNAIPLYHPNPQQCSHWPIKLKYWSVKRGHKIYIFSFKSQALPLAFFLKKKKKYWRIIGQKKSFRSFNSYWTFRHQSWGFNCLSTMITNMIGCITTSAESKWVHGTKRQAALRLLT